MKIAIIGSGVYGCYLYNLLKNKKSLETKMFDAGGISAKNEEEIDLTALSKNYLGSKLGRYFGHGGSSVKWGGQILFFDEFDKTEDKLWNRFVDLNLKHKDLICKRLNILTPIETKLDGELNVKEGIWLSPNKRDLRKHFAIEHDKITSNKTLISINRNNEKYFLNFRDSTTELFDRIYITSGAIEGFRILNDSKETLKLSLFPDKLQLSDHLSVRSHQCYNSKLELNGVNFNPKFNDFNLITKRIVLNDKNVKGYIHFIFNENNIFFSLIKKYVYGIDNNVKLTFLNLTNALTYPFKMGVSFLKGNLFVEKKEWGIQIDLDKAETKLGTIIFEKMNNLDPSTPIINWEISKVDVEKFKKIQSSVSEILVENNISFKKIDIKDFQNIADVYHPTRVLSIQDNGLIDIDCKIKEHNIFIFNTGILKHASTINPTASVLALIEEHYERNYV